MNTGSQKSWKKRKTFSRPGPSIAMSHIADILAMVKEIYVIYLLGKVCGLFWFSWFLSNILFFSALGHSTPAFWLGHPIIIIYYWWLGSGLGVPYWEDVGVVRGRGCKGEGDSNDKISIHLWNSQKVNENKIPQTTGNKGSHRFAKIARKAIVQIKWGRCSQDWQWPHERGALGGTFSGKRAARYSGLWSERLCIWIARLGMY